MTVTSLKECLVVFRVFRETFKKMICGQTEFRDMLVVKYYVQYVFGQVSQTQIFGILNTPHYRLLKETLFLLLATCHSYLANKQI